MRRPLLVAALLVWSVVVPAAPARAHAVLLSSEPASGARVEAPPDTVTLTFSEQPDPKVADIGVLDTGGRPFAGSVALVRGDDRSLRVTVRALPDGVYTVTWRVLSRVDGHVTGGAFAFGVRESPSAVAAEIKDAPSTPPVAPLGVAGRWLLYAGLMILVGSVWTGVFAFSGAPPGVRALSGAAWIAAFAGMVLIIEAQRSDAGLAVGDLFGTSIGTGLLWRSAPLLLAGALLLLRQTTWAAIGAGAAAMGTMLAHVWYGHAAARSSPAIRAAAQWIHFGAGGVWIGGLAAVLVGIRRSGPDVRARAIRRFSAAALVSVLVVSATGSLRAFNEVDSWSKLGTTSYGRVVLLKIALLLALIALGARNRFRHVPTGEHGVPGLRRVSRAELGIAVVVLAATGLLASLTPSRSVEHVASRDAAAVVARGEDFGTTVRVVLRVSPGRPGPNAFALDVRDFDSGVAADADSVVLSFRSALRRDLELSTLALERGLGGIWRAQASNLAVAGVWNVTARIARGSDSIEVPLSVPLRAAQQMATVPGDPTLYNVTLADGSLVQFYAQRGAPGRYEVHATFFTMAGGEFAGLEDIALVGTPAGGRARVFDVRVLSPGHVVSDAELSAGIWRFDVAARRAGGFILTAYFEETIAA